MNANEATANGSLTELRQSQLAAERIRPTEPAEPRGGGLQLVPDEGGDFLKGLFANSEPDPVADTARGGSRLDNQGRLEPRAAADRAPAHRRTGPARP